jgi:hypothetical protein
MARLAAYVHVQDDQGATHVFGPADDVPAWAAEKITNPKAWEGSEESEGKPAAPRGDKAPARRRTPKE